MRAKQWAARAVMAAAMAAGLSACGGGGDGAKPEPVPEPLPVGIKVENAQGDVPPNGQYNVVRREIRENIIVSAMGSEPRPGFTSYYFDDGKNPEFGGIATVDASGLVVQVVITYGDNADDQPMGCGNLTPGHPCSGFTIDPVAKKLTANKVVLKSLLPDWSGLNTTPGQFTISGIVTERS